MASQKLADRVTQLEAQVNELRRAVHASGQPGGKDWRRAVGKFAGDDDLQSILQEAMELRAADRKRVRAKPAKQNGKRR